MDPGRVPASAAVGPQQARAWRSLLKDMRQALLSEIGARSIYDHLSRRVQDPELRSLLVHLNQEGVLGVERLRELMRGLGGRPRRTSFRRRAMARALCASSRVVGVRTVLRVCAHAEETVSRWYAEYSAFFMRSGDRERAHAFGRMSIEKQIRARALGAWVTNLRRR
ncbi:MAG: demethoxyubiquinone hydroxylase (CLK1/Coq7/Cat5 family) [Chlamydiales bacterium]|jgi:demethoxyubiquinone hydroxylase (CLK1/Coq7/Cat5 family)